MEIQKIVPVGRCEFCRCTNDTMDQVEGEPVGWEDMRQTRCLQIACIAKRPTAKKIADRKLETDRRDAVRPVKQRFSAERKRRNERKAKRKKIANSRTNRTF